MPAAVLPRLRGRFGRPYLYALRCGSTQRLLGGPELPQGAVAVAEEQTEGRGRLGRRWEAPPRSSVLVSLLLLPAVAPARLPELSPAAGGACAAAIAAVTGLVPEVKFPNDVLIGGRKVAGVLAEAQGGRVVLGTGVNVNVAVADLPRDVRLPATSLLAETGAQVDRVELLVTLLEELERTYDAFVALRR